MISEVSAHYGREVTHIQSLLVGKPHCPYPVVSMSLRNMVGHVDLPKLPQWPCDAHCPL